MDDFDDGLYIFGVGLAANITAGTQLKAGLLDTFKNKPPTADVKKTTWRSCSCSSTSTNGMYVAVYSGRSYGTADKRWLSMPLTAAVIVDTLHQAAGSRTP